MSVPPYIYHAMKDNELLQAGSLSTLLKRRQRLLTVKDNELSQAVEPAGAPLRRPTHFSPPRILVVDEDRDLRQLYAEALARPGYHVDAAEDGAAALGGASGQQLQSSDHRAQPAQADRR